MIDVSMLRAGTTAAQPFSPTGLACVSYVNSVLQPNETVKIIGKLHWTIYVRAWLFAAIAAALLYYGARDYTQMGRIAGYLGWLSLAIAAALFLQAWFRHWTMELAVTTHRVIYKRGFIWRHTVEMNMDKVETVNVDQSIMGRMLGYGTIYIRGTGQGIESLRSIGSPIAVRSAITAR
jgi:uncharacterized membrane protein YdbT with pleckstrin-like domain